MDHKESKTEKEEAKPEEKPVVKKPGNLTETDKHGQVSAVSGQGQPSGGAPEAKNGVVGGDKAKEEQERTRINKRLFLEAFGKMRGIITQVCLKVGISRETYYDWKRNDPEFARAVSTIESNRANEIEDMLIGKIFAEKDGPSIRYWLDRKHPGYKPKNVTEVVVGEKTLEDLLDEEEKSDDNKNNDKNQPGINREINADTGQAGNADAVQIQPGAGILLGPKDEKKPDSESKAEGVE